MSGGKRGMRKWGDTLVLVLATGLGLGWSPVVPATVGALLGLPLAWWMATALSFAEFFLVQAALLFVSVLLCDRAEQQLGRKDDRRIVADEIATLPLVMAGLPLSDFPWLLASGFILHRVLDILKPWPARSLQRVSGGPGIVLDDAVSSLYALALHWGFYLWFRMPVDRGWAQLMDVISGR